MSGTFPFEIYRKDNVVVILPIFEPIKSEHLNFTKTIVEWSIKEGFKQAILVGGLDKRLQDDHNMKAIYTKKFKDTNPEVDIPILDEGLYVTGPLAYMLMFYELNNFPAVSLLPYAERSRPDPVSPSNAIEQINRILNIDVNIHELLEEAEKIEKEIESLIKASKQQADKDKDIRKRRKSSGGLWLCKTAKRRCRACKNGVYHKQLHKRPPDGACRYAQSQERQRRG